MILGLVVSNTKLSLEYIRIKFAEVGYILLEDEYRNNKQLLEYVCSNGHRRKVRWNDFQQHHRCPECQNMHSPSFSYVNREFSKRGFVLLSTEFQSAHKELEYICPVGHKGKITWHSFRKNCGCSVCIGTKRKTIQEVRKLFSDCGIVLLTNEYRNSNTRLLGICSKGHVFETSLSAFHHRCPVCFGNKTTLDNILLLRDFDLCREWDYTKNSGVSPATVSIGSNKKVWWKCTKCSHSWKAPVYNRCVKKEGCRFCSKGPVSKISQEWLDSIGVATKNREVLLPDLGLRVDGFDPETNTVYEFLGDYWHGNPNRFNSLHLNKNASKTFGQLFDETLERLFLLRQNGYSLNIVWEADFTKAHN